jgi:anti-sigma factor RsiW
MFEKHLQNKLDQEAAADLIDQNVSFDFKSFLRKIGPAPSFSEPIGPTAQCLSVDMIYAFHGSELNTSARAEVEKHVASCEACSELLASYAQSQPARMPERLFERISSRLRRASAAPERETAPTSFWSAFTQMGRWLAVPATALVLAWILYPARPFFYSGSAPKQQPTSISQVALQQDISALKDRLAKDEQANTELQGDLKVVTDKLRITQGQLIKARQETAERDAETTEKLTALDTSVHSELATKASNDDVKTVDTKVTTVSSNLDRTNNDLNMARSELGTLIAKNHDEIDVLRRLGERDYVEFTVSGKNHPEKIGNVTVELKGVNEKHNRANLVYTVDDKRFEEKNRSINQPIFFYVSGMHQPEELVINKIGENSISGYLSAPKSTSAPGSSSRN